MNVRNIKVKSLQYSATVVLYTILFSAHAIGQSCIQNPSLEGPSQNNVVPSPWSICGGSPDTQPGQWGITQQASDGSSYVSFLQIGNAAGGYFEGATQAFDTCLTAGNTYTVSVDLAHSDIYNTAIPGNCYSSMEIWLGDTLCTENELVWQSGKIMHTAWQTYTFSFTPAQNRCYISFRPYWIDSCSDHINILMDNFICDAIVSATTTPITCNGGCDGTATMITSGTPPFTYSWNDPQNQTSPTATGLCAGTYIGTVLDSNGVTDSALVTLVDPTEITAIGTSTSSTCGQMNGTACVSLSDGCAPYTVVWDDPNTTVGICTDSVYAGVYNALVTDCNGCQASRSVIINDVTTSTNIDSLITVNSSCAGDSNGLATVYTTVASPPITYYWKNGPDTVGANAATVLGLWGGIFTVTIEDANGCFSSQLFVINEPLPLTAAITNSTDATCSGSCDGSATVTVGRGTPPYSYSWANGCTTSACAALCAGTNNIFVTDANNCVTSVGVLINEAAPIVITEAITHVSCNGGSDGGISVSVTGGYCSIQLSMDTGHGGHESQCRDLYINLNR